MSANPHLSRRGLLGMTAAVPLALTLGSGVIALITLELLKPVLRPRLQS